MLHLGVKSAARKLSSDGTGTADLLLSRHHQAAAIYSIRASKSINYSDFSVFLVSSSLME